MESKQLDFTDVPLSSQVESKPLSSQNVHVYKVAIAENTNGQFNHSANNTQQYLSVPTQFERRQFTEQRYSPNGSIYSVSNGHLPRRI